MDLLEADGPIGELSAVTVTCWPGSPPGSTASTGADYVRVEFTMANRPSVSGGLHLADGQAFVGRLCDVFQGTGVAVEVMDGARDH